MGTQPVTCKEEATTALITHASDPTVLDLTIRTGDTLKVPPGILIGPKQITVLDQQQQGVSHLLLPDQLQQDQSRVI
jgi:hypothetical protein